MEEELDYNEHLWNYEQVCEDQVPNTNTLQIKGRIKLAEINHEERVWRIERKVQHEIRYETESAKIRSLEKELKSSRKKEQDESEKNRILMCENTKLKQRLKKIESQYEKRKVEIDVALDAFLLDPKADFDEFFESLKFR